MKDLYEKFRISILLLELNLRFIDGKNRPFHLPDCFKSEIALLKKDVEAGVFDKKISHIKEQIYGIKNKSYWINEMLKGQGKPKISWDNFICDDETFEVAKKILKIS